MQVQERWAYEGDAASQTALEPICRHLLMSSQLRLVETQLLSNNILSLNARDADPSFLENSGIISLVADGYRISLQEARAELTQDLKNPRILIAPHPDRPGQAGGILITGDVSFSGREGLEIGGIVVAPDNPERREGGVADRLLFALAELYDRSFYIGISCNRYAMDARKRVFAKLNHATQVGNYALHGELSTRQQLAVAEISRQFVRTHGGVLTKSGIAVVPRHYLPKVVLKNTKKLSDLESQIQHDLDYAQRQIDDDKTAGMVLISVKGYCF